MSTALEHLERQAERFKALGHPTRMLLIEALRDGTRCVCELVPLAPCDLSTVSRHLAVLRHAGLVERRREGTKVLYTLRPQALAACAALLESLGARESTR